MENRGEKENPCVRAFVALFSHESERSADARRRRIVERSSWKAERYGRNDGKAFSLSP